jgi:oxygen-independent coproporphyrinogen-3 oxidase
LPGVYISYPFCAQKCTYCNFASGVFPRALEVEYNSALAAEIGAFDWAGRADTLYLGGGTPSLLSDLPALPWREFDEATLEAAPGTITAERVESWQRAGINRVSLGVQSLVPKEIARTGRKHTAEIVAEEVRLLQSRGLANVNVDLIAGLAGQTRESWRESLDWVERLEAPHVSVYILEVDEDSRLGSELLLGGVRYGALDVPGEELIVELYETAVARLAALGIERYEISNFARPGFESRHNLKYWQLEPYVGFGADAHSYDGRWRWQNVESAGDYVARWRAGESPRADAMEVNADEERFFVGLRLMRGIEPAAAEWERWAGPIERFTSAGLLVRDGDRLKLTARGVLLSNEVFQEFLA